MRRISSLLLLLILSVVPSISRAAEPGGKIGNAGILFGIGFPSYSSSVYTLGLGGTWMWKPFLGFGATFQTSSIGLNATSDAGTTSISMGTFLYGVDASLYLAGSLQNFSTGLRLGLISVGTTGSASVTGADPLSINNHTLYFFLAPRIGYDVPIGRVSVGGELSYLFSIGANPPAILSLLVAGKFWF